ncbi:MULTISPECIES: methyltransferase domain-containing protein [Kribbella]|uniref:Methyltransferase domain-containing protein n=1 Tax=Kribbella sancticallisti TaxID=460087 RepID=A0ABN2EGW1_9ACTN|nr:methyltransferase domain-containing protein [Kribbella catacumbae]
MAVASVMRQGINTVLRPLGVQMIRARTTDRAIQAFLPAKQTIAAAKRAGLSVGDYLDQYSAEPQVTAAAVQALLQMSALGNEVDRVCEIGPGSGRYAEKVIEALRPSAYEIYETASDWLPYLRKLPNLVERPADGHTLSATATSSVDLVQAHKLFVYIPFVTTVGYLEEMARVVRPGGIVAFDIVTESCLDEQATKTWVAGNAVIYMVTPRSWTVELLDRRGLDLVGSHFEPLSGGLTELLVFRKRRD